MSNKFEFTIKYLFDEGTFVLDDKEPDIPNVAGGVGLINGRKVFLITEVPGDVVDFFLATNKKKMLLKLAVALKIPIVVVVSNLIDRELVTSFSLKEQNLEEFYISKQGLHHFLLEIGRVSGTVPIVGLLANHMLFGLSFQFPMFNASVILKDLAVCLTTPDYASKLLGKKVDVKHYCGAKM